MSAASRRPRATLRATLVGLLLATVAVMCLVIGAVTHISVHDQLSAQVDGQLSRASDRAVHLVAPDADDTPVRPPSTQDAGGPGGGEYELGARVRGGTVTSASWRRQDGTVRTLNAQDTRIIARAAAELTSGTGESAEGEGRQGPTGRDVHLSIGEYRVVAHAESDGDVIVTGLPLTPMHMTLTRLDLTLLGAGTAALLVTGIAGWLIVRRTMRPLEEVAAVAADVAEMPLASGAVTLAQRVPAARAHPGTEVGEVGRALNHLLDNVEGALSERQASEERMRRFVADASHELRTPLTAIRGYTEILHLTEDLSDQGERSIARLEAQSQRMTTLVDDLLLLARLDDGAPRADEEVDLGEIVVESVLDAKVTGADHQWQLAVPPEPVQVMGDPRQLTQVVVNLLSNARKHTPEGTTVQVALDRPDQAPGQVELTVADDGPGIAPEMLGSVFDRFTRADAARSGRDQTTGLGLPIVRAIARAHGGDVTVASESGSTVFTLALPAAGGSAGSSGAAESIEGEGRA